MVLIWGHNVHVFIVRGPLVRMGRKLWKSLSEVCVDGRAPRYFRGVAQKQWREEYGLLCGFWGSHSMAWSVPHALHLSCDWLIEDQSANLPRAVLKFVQAMSCTRAPGWGLRGLEFHLVLLSSRDPCSGSLPEVGVPFLTCIWAKGSPEILFDPHPSDGKVWSSSPHLQLWMFFKEVDMPMAKVDSFWRCVFCSVKERGKNKRGKERKERNKKKNEDKVVLLPRKLWMHCPSLDTAAKG